MPPTLDDTVAQRPQALSAEINGETILMSMDSSLYIGLQATSRDIWHRLATPVTVRDLCNSLSEAYGAPLPQVEADTLAFLSHLEQRGLIHYTG
ncbi:PqqD family protein [Novispirillum itersonii]|uniref:PqqD family protein n=1 Tax=Novispirillum itersonii TaxID=189 RepID=A0A7X0DNV8_NOVIT|nr:PqqD family protein [Novispirillum itersonii]MBB6212400.1 hypothetical protein [Novispirillum itersonii]